MAIHSTLPATLLVSPFAHFHFGAGALRNMTLWFSSICLHLRRADIVASGVCRTLPAWCKITIWVFSFWAIVRSALVMNVLQQHPAGRSAMPLLQGNFVRVSRSYPQIMVPPSTGRPSTRSPRDTYADRRSVPFCAYSSSYDALNTLFITQVRCCACNLYVQRPARPRCPNS